MFLQVMLKLIPFGKQFLAIMGIEVDIEASYKKMKKDGKFNEEKLVFKQVKPIFI